MTSSPTTDVPVPESPVTTLQCVEIWGGSQRVDRGISLVGLLAHINAEPHNGASNGGDLYYLSTCGLGHVSRFVLADVSGHGESVGDVAALLRKLMRKFIGTPNQADFAAMLNRQFAKMAEEGRFATAVLGTYFAPTDHLMLCNAGHPAPLWYRAATGRWQFLQHDQVPSDGDPSNLPFGVLEPTAYEQFVVKLEPEDLLVIYTDALIEASDAFGRQLGQQGLLDLVQQVDVAPPAELNRRIITAVNQHRGGEAADDDQTLLVIRHTAADARMTIGKTIRAMAKMIGLGKVYIDPGEGV